MLGSYQAEYLEANSRQDHIRYYWICSYPSCHLTLNPELRSRREYTDQAYRWKTSYFWFLPLVNALEGKSLLLRIYCSGQKANLQTSRSSLEALFFPRSVWSEWNTKFDGEVADSHLVTPHFTIVLFLSLSLKIVKNIHIHRVEFKEEVVVVLDGKRCSVFFGALSSVLLSLSLSLSSSLCGKSHLLRISSLLSSYRNKIVIFRIGRGWLFRSVR